MGRKQRETELTHLTDEEIDRLARDPNISKKGRRRYQREQKYRGRRNVQRRKRSEGRG